MKYAETKWVKLKARIDTIDSIPSLMKFIENTRERQKHNLDYETSKMVAKSLAHMRQRMRLLNQVTDR